MKLITNPMKPRLNNFPGFPDALDNKRALYDHWFMHSEKGLKTNPLPHWPVNKEAARNAVPDQNLPGFISRNSSNNPFSTEGKALFPSGKQA